MVTYPSKFGFILTRHITSDATNRYWNHSLKLLRTLYPRENIVVIDDNSTPEFVHADHEYTNVVVILSEFPGAGEILPYYYYIKQPQLFAFEYAVILHDSVFIHKRIRFERILDDKVAPLWYFHPDRENITNTLKLTENLRNTYGLRKSLTMNDAVLGIPHTKWYGCFGSQAIIHRTFLAQLERKYGISALVRVVKTRADRCCLERILGCIFCAENGARICHAGSRAIFGDIMQHQKWCGYTFDDYMADFKRGVVIRPVVKVWSGR